MVVGIYYDEQFCMSRYYPSESFTRIEIIDFMYMESSGTEFDEILVLSNDDCVDSFRPCEVKEDSND